MSKDLELPLLYDLYGALLTEKQRELFSYYYHDDLSLGEIAEQEGITRQGVRDTVKRAGDQLKELEQSLGLLARFGRVEAAAAQIRAKCAALLGAGVTEKAAVTLEEIAALTHALTPWNEEEEHSDGI